jgi:leucyl aminopeptidase
MRVTYPKALSAKPDMLICPIFENAKPSDIFDVKVKKVVEDMKKNKLFKAESGNSKLMYSSVKGLPKRILLIGLGKKAKASDASVRNTVAKTLKGHQTKDINIVGLMTYPDLSQYMQAAAEGIMLINYNPAQYKTGKNPKKVTEKLFAEVMVFGKLVSAADKKALKRAKVLSESVNIVRDLVNGPPNYISVDGFANEAKKVAKKNKISIKVYDKAWIAKKKMGAFLSVNSGSGKKTAQLVVMEYKPKKMTKKEPILLVGKGLIFDAGGYNLKPSRHIEDMHQDKAGGALVVGIFNALKDMNINRHVVGIVPLTENLIDADAQKPSDVVTSYSGQTVEIRNTDAEGRMILADALTYGVETYKPEYTIDFATLTGACVVALGDRYAGLMGNNEALISKLKKSGDKTEELAWELPIHDDFREGMKGVVSDLRNIDNGTSSLAGASKAAAFLEYFVGKAKWAHLDIAGVAYNERPKAIDFPRATGYGVRMMIDFLENC